MSENVCPKCGAKRVEWKYVKGSEVLFPVYDCDTSGYAGDDRFIEGERCLRNQLAQANESVIRDLLGPHNDDSATVGVLVLGVVKRVMELEGRLSELLSSRMDAAEAKIGTRPLEQVLRPELAWFAVEMEKTLRKNDHKPHWRGSLTRAEALHRITEELLELTFEVNNDGDIDSIVSEATDVANFAMMIADLTAMESEAMERNRERAGG